MLEKSEFLIVSHTSILKNLRTYRVVLVSDVSYKVSKVHIICISD